MSTELIFLKPTNQPTMREWVSDRETDEYFNIFKSIIAKLIYRALPVSFLHNPDEKKNTFLIGFQAFYDENEEKRGLNFKFILRFNLYRIQEKKVMSGECKKNLNF